LTPPEKPLRPIDELLDVMRRLRDPQSGCAWDIQQTFATIAPYTVEEAYEVADAIERADLAELKDELGDLLFQVVFHAQMASEQSAFTFNDVAAGIVDKMIRRHPHVFGDASFASTAELNAAWEAGKAREREAKRGRDGTDEQPASALDGIAKTLPALQRAEKLQKRAARVGFDWPDSASVWDKLDEEIGEVREAAQAADNDALADELGDLLFTVVNLARHYQVDANSALSRANAKFEKRFRLVEQLAVARNELVSEMDLPGLDELWEEAKEN
jgi:MazG family protein